MNPIELAVLPLKQAAIDASVEYATNLIAKIHTDLEKHGWDLDKAAPRGNSFRDGRNEYIQKNAKHNLYESVTAFVNGCTRPGEPHFRQKSVEREQSFIERAKKGAAESYDMYVGKLISKVGEVKDAKLDGGFVWSLSYLTVTKLDGSIEKWKTQQIINVSKLGTLFNQWPTRKVK